MEDAKVCVLKHKKLIRQPEKSSPSIRVGNTFFWSLSTMTNIELSLYSFCNTRPAFTHSISKRASQHHDKCKLSWKCSTGSRLFENINSVDVTAQVIKGSTSSSYKQLYQQMMFLKKPDSFGPKCWHRVLNSRSFAQNSIWLNSITTATITFVTNG